MREISNAAAATGGMPSTPRNLSEESSNRGRVRAIHKSDASTNLSSARCDAAA